MAKSKSTTSKALSRDGFIEAYMNYVLEHEKTPASVFKFCKELKSSEEQFYGFFGSFDGLRQAIWNSFFDHTVKLLEKNKDYAQFANREKMLSFYFTFFELLTANRSYVLYTLGESRDVMKNLSELKGLRKHIKEFASELIEEANDNRSNRLLKQPVPVFSEGAWLQTLFIMKFWMEDNSPSFEKTDLVIEKSVRAIFDLFDNTPLESVLDFGKFLWKEQMN
jgi:hypothetical protein